MFCRWELHRGRPARVRGPAERCPMRLALEGTSTASMYGWAVSGARREAVMRGLFLGVEERGVCFWGGNGESG